LARRLKNPRPFRAGECQNSAKVEQVLRAIEVSVDNRQIQFRDGLSPEPDRVEAGLQQLQDLLAAGAFWAQNRNLTDLAVAIAHSNVVISAWDGDRLVGFGRALSDGIYRATIWDVVVHPDYRGSGLGRKLVETVLAHPSVCRVERVYLMTTHQQTFYERIGFEQNATTTMVLTQAPQELADCPREAPLTVHE
jgi:N-acetylglutamate synthase-like GNAT family acetyltransferase